MVGAIDTLRPISFASGAKRIFLGIRFA